MSTRYAVGGITSRNGVMHTPNGSAAVVHLTSQASGDSYRGYLLPSSWNCLHSMSRGYAVGGYHRPRWSDAHTQWECRGEASRSQASGAGPESAVALVSLGTGVHGICRRQPYNSRAQQCSATRVGCNLSRRARSPGVQALCPARSRSTVNHRSRARARSGRWSRRTGCNEQAGDEYGAPYQ